MAGFSCNGIESLELSLKEIQDIPQDVQDTILNAQADVVVTAQKKSARETGVSPHSEMMQSIGKTKPKVRKDGRVIYVYPQGVNSSGTRNAEVAFIREYGALHRNQPGKMFMRIANERSAEEATQAAVKVYDSWLKSKNL